MSVVGIDEEILKAFNKYGKVGFRDVEWAVKHAEKTFDFKNDDAYLLLCGNLFSYLFPGNTIEPNDIPQEIRNFSQSILDLKRKSDEPIILDYERYRVNNITYAFGRDSNGVALRGNPIKIIHRKENDQVIAIPLKNDPAMDPNGIRENIKKYKTKKAGKETTMILYHDESYELNEFVDKFTESKHRDDLRYCLHAIQYETGELMLFGFRVENNLLIPPDYIHSFLPRESGIARMMKDNILLSDNMDEVKKSALEHYSILTNKQKNAYLLVIGAFLANNAKLRDFNYSVDIIGSRDVGKSLAIIAALHDFIGFTSGIRLKYDALDSDFRAQRLLDEINIPLYLEEGKLKPQVLKSLKSGGTGVRGRADQSLRTMVQKATLIISRNSRDTDINYDEREAVAKRMPSIYFNSSDAIRDPKLQVKGEELRKRLDDTPGGILFNCNVDLNVVWDLYTELYPQFKDERKVLISIVSRIFDFPLPKFDFGTEPSDNIITSIFDFYDAITAGYNTPEIKNFKGQNINEIMEFDEKEKVLLLSRNAFELFLSEYTSFKTQFENFNQFVNFCKDQGLKYHSSKKIGKSFKAVVFLKLKDNEGDNPDFQNSNDSKPDGNNDGLKPIESSIIDANPESINNTTQFNDDSEKVNNQKVWESPEAAWAFVGKYVHDDADKYISYDGSDDNYTISLKGEYTYIFKEKFYVNYNNEFTDPETSLQFKVNPSYLNKIFDLLKEKLTIEQIYSNFPQTAHECIKDFIYSYSNKIEYLTDSHEYILKSENTEIKPKTPNVKNPDNTHITSNEATPSIENKNNDSEIIENKVKQSKNNPNKDSDNSDAKDTGQSNNENSLNKNTFKTPEAAWSYINSFSQIADIKKNIVYNGNNEYKIRLEGDFSNYKALSKNFEMKISDNYTYLKFSVDPNNLNRILDILEYENLSKPAICSAMPQTDPKLIGTFINAHKNEIKEIEAYHEYALNPEFYKDEISYWYVARITPLNPNETKYHLNYRFKLSRKAAADIKPYIFARRTSKEDYTANTEMNDAKPDENIKRAPFDTPEDFHNAVLQKYNEAVKNGTKPLITDIASALSSLKETVQPSDVYKEIESIKKQQQKEIEKPKETKKAPETQETQETPVIQRKSDIVETKKQQDSRHRNEMELPDAIIDAVEVEGEKKQFKNLTIDEIFKIFQEDGRKSDYTKQKIKEICDKFYDTDGKLIRNSFGYKSKPYDL